MNPPPAGTTAQAVALAAAVDSGQILPHYQPIVNISSGRTVGVEALARWQHPDHGLLPPISVPAIG